MTTPAKIFGWLEIALAGLAAFICTAALFDLATADPEDMSVEWSPLLVALTLPLSLSLAWGGWHLIRRQDWLHQAVPFFVFLSAATFVFVIDYA